jgi:hypothetical protein
MHSALRATGFLVGLALPMLALQAPEPGAPISAHSLQTARPATPRRLCAGSAECLSLRWLEVDWAALGATDPGGDWIAYDYEDLTRPVSYADFEGERELSLAVRLILSEVGADRLVESRNGLLEAVAILYTVDNRLDPATANPQGVPGYYGFPGCGPGGDFASCANADEYLGMNTWRATRPASGYDAALLRAAMDVAVTAWVIQERGLIADFTGGATSYVHRCGGAAYGRPTPWCHDGLIDGVADVPGARPHAGPATFRAPTELDPRGYYRMQETIWVDYLPLSAADPEAAVGWRMAPGSPRG